jgi:hypothetical protein
MKFGVFTNVRRDCPDIATGSVTNVSRQRGFCYDAIFLSAMLRRRRLLLEGVGTIT